MGDLSQHKDTPLSSAPYTECDLCDRMYRESALLFLGTMHKFDGAVAVFICEACTRKAVEALARKRAANA